MLPSGRVWHAPWRRQSEADQNRCHFLRFIIVVLCLLFILTLFYFIRCFFQLPEKKCKMYHCHFLRFITVVLCLLFYLLCYSSLFVVFFSTAREKCKKGRYHFLSFFIFNLCLLFYIYLILLHSLFFSTVREKCKKYHYHLLRILSLS